MPPKKKPKAKKMPVKQKQKQRQSQRVVINLVAPRTQRRKRVTKPRVSARPNTARVLDQFIQPESMFPQRVIFPSQPPPPLVQQSNPLRSPILINEQRERRPAVPAPVRSRGQPRVVSDVMKSVEDAERVLEKSSGMTPNERAKVRSAAERRVRSAIEEERLAVERVAADALSAAAGRSVTKAREVSDDINRTLSNRRNTIDEMRSAQQEQIADDMAARRLAKEMRKQPEIYSDPMTPIAPPFPRAAPPPPPPFGGAAAEDTEQGRSLFRSYG